VDTEEVSGHCLSESIQQGKAVEQGTHAELMRIDGLYSTFYRMQFREEGLETIHLL